MKRFLNIFMIIIILLNSVHSVKNDYDQYKYKYILNTFNLPSHIELVFDIECESYIKMMKYKEIVNSENNFEIYNYKNKIDKLFD